MKPKEAGQAVVHGVAVARLSQIGSAAAKAAHSQHVAKGRQVAATPGAPLQRAPQPK